MKLKSLNKNWIEALKVFAVSLCVVIGTFPENLWDFGSGIDPSLVWVFNYIADTNFNIGQNIIFPHGPLAFFMYPLPENIIAATLITMILKVLLIFNLYVLLKRFKSAPRLLVTFFVGYFVCLIGGILTYILTNLILLYCNFYNEKKNFYKYSAFLLMAFAFYIKSYVCIISVIITFSFLMYFLITTKKWKKTLIDSLIIIVLIVLIWLLMYGNLHGFFKYLFGLFNLAQDNSSAASYYPKNNWWWLSISIFIIVILPFINKDKKSLFYGFLIILSLFAAWKHGMAREDIYHVNGLFHYIIVVLLIFVLFVKVNFYRNFILSVFAVFMFSLNITNAVNYRPRLLEFNRSHYFWEFVTEFKARKDISHATSNRDISKMRMPSEIIEQIGNSSVDIYPWDYSIIPANQLNWQPRVVIQSYAAYTSWLDKQNANHFNSEKAPEFLIWHLQNWSTGFNLNGGNFNGIDYRYLLNDEPSTIIELMKNYERYYSNEKFIVFKKRPMSLLSESNIVGQIETTWQEWIDVPHYDNSVIRAKLHFDKSFLQRAKSFFYKDEEFFIQIKLDDGMVCKYKIVPKNAEDGLWINPYYDYRNDKWFSFNIEQIMFSCSNQEIMSEKLVVEWDKITFNKNPEWFDNMLSVQNVIFSIFNDYEKDSVLYWTGRDENNYSDVSVSGKRSQIVPANSFSQGLRFPMENISDGKYFITANCCINLFDEITQGDILLVVSVEDENKKESVTWNGTSVSKLLNRSDYGKWNSINNSIIFENNPPNKILKVYFWNNSNKDIYIDDFRVNIYEN